MEFKPDQELLNSEIDKELSKLCDHVEKYELYDASYDDELIKICELGSAINQTKQIGGTLKRADQELFNSEFDKDLCELCDNVERDELYDASYDDELIKICELESAINQTKQIGGELKRVNEAKMDIMNVKRSRYDEGASTSTIETSTIDDDKVNCSTCNACVSKIYFANHLKSNAHKYNILKSHSSLTDVSVIGSAFGQRIISYKMNGTTDESSKLLPEIFLNSVKDDILCLIDKCIDQHTIFKVNFILQADFIKQIKGISNSFQFQTYNFIIFRGYDLNLFFSSLCNTLTNKVSSFEKKDSGWSLIAIKCLDMNVNKFNPLRGTAYIDLPRDIRLKKAVINVKNVDNLCFKWALLSALYPVSKNSDRVTSYSMHSDKLKFDGVTFPVKFLDIPKVEKFNNISINVFGLEYNSATNSHTIVGPLFLTKSRQRTHINLLYTSNGTNGHYCYIKNLSRLVSKQISNCGHAIHICDGCLLKFPTEERLNQHQQHDCFHISTQLPNKEKTSENWFGEPVSNDKLKFDKYEKKLKIPFVIYADFEALLNPVESCPKDPSSSYTHNIQKHDVYSFGYYIKCSYDDSLSKYETYSGPNCAQVFMTRLYNDLKNICKKNSFQKRREPLSTVDEHTISTTKTCHICETELKEHSFLDFDWYTGRFRGVVHEICLKKFRAPRHIPVLLHNFSDCDAHFIVHALNFADGDVEVIPQNEERYISFSKKLTVNNQQIHLRFVDSFKFLSCSLDQLVKNLNPTKFETLKKNYPNEEDFNLLRRKGVNPYEFMKSFDCLQRISLPKENEFYSSLNESNVSNYDYYHAQKVWQHFKCGNMSDYLNLYLKTDVMLLTDVFENFRELCIKTYGLDPSHYYTAPGLSWDAMLKYTKAELELLTDFDKIAFIKAGIRGGILQCSNRYAKANNEFIEDYDKDKPKSYLIYLDANNLYGWAMSQYLPIGDFEWVSSETNFDVSDKSDFGFILEVDLAYPDELHNLHSDLPLCPENICIGNTTDIKLIPNLNNKFKYKIHYRNLLQCLKMGIKLTKVHRILKFKQSPWLQKYINLNTELRTLATSDFEKDFYKLMNNSIVGKTIENIDKRVKVKLLTHWENRGKVLGAQDFIAKPEFHNLSIFSENLVAVQLRKTKLVYNKPIYLGFCILDISKTLMYDFHYNYMIKKFYAENVKLLYTDTDSLIYQVFTENFYKDLKPDLSTRFDTSDYPSDNIFEYPTINKKRLGFFKDGNNGNVMKEFVGLRSKMYAFEVENKVVAKPKGVNKSVTKKIKIEHCSMLRFRSLKRKIFTQEINKTCLSLNDTKRHILPNNVDTSAWGHHKLR